jgi:hypothetical protein
VSSTRPGENGGRLLNEIATRGHLWLGFSERDVRRMLVESGSDPARIRYQVLPQDARAKGPAMFVAVGR